jgi:hypothetical protein
MAAAKAAPIVPEDNANAVEELRPSNRQYARGTTHTVRSRDDHVDLARVQVM